MTSILGMGNPLLDISANVEQAVLDGARETIARDRPSLLIEMEAAHTKQPIEEALACGDVEKVLASLAEPDAVDGKGSTILHRVCGSCARRCSM